MLYLIGNFYSVLLPGVLGGDVVRAAMCRTKTGGTATAVLASIGIERGLGLGCHADRHFQCFGCRL